MVSRSPASLAAKYLWAAFVSGTVSHERRSQMNNWCWKGMLAAAIAFPALTGVAWADNNDGCSERHAQGPVRLRRYVVHATRPA